jgi:hypothetical protein
MFMNVRFQRILINQPDDFDYNGPNKTEGRKIYERLFSESCF